jgi:hypothetical protein
MKGCIAAFADARTMTSTTFWVFPTLLCAMIVWVISRLSWPSSPGMGAALVERITTRENQGHRFLQVYLFPSTQ